MLKRSAIITMMSLFLLASMSYAYAQCSTGRQIKEQKSVCCQCSCCVCCQCAK